MNISYQSLHIATKTTNINNKCVTYRADMYFYIFKALLCHTYKRMVIQKCYMRHEPSTLTLFINITNLRNTKVRLINKSNTKRI